MVNEAQTGAVLDCPLRLQQQGQRGAAQRPAGSGGTQACPLCLLRQAAAQHQRRCIQVRSLAAEEASAVADEPTSGSVSEQERAQYERWAAEVAVSVLLSLRIFKPEHARWSAVACLFQPKSWPMQEYGHKRAGRGGSMTARILLACHHCMQWMACSSLFWQASACRSPHTFVQEQCTMACMLTAGCGGVCAKGCSRRRS